MVDYKDFSKVVNNVSRRENMEEERLVKALQTVKSKLHFGLQDVSNKTAIEILI